MPSAKSISAADENGQKKHALAKAVGPLCHPPKPKGAKTPFSSGKAAALLTRGAYSQYVSANAAKSGKSVSPKVRQMGENAAGDFFQHSHYGLPDSSHQTHHREEDGDGDKPE